MSETLRRSFVLLAWTAAAMAALLAFLPAAGHDQLWFLLMARRWLDGATLYGPETFDSNPPLIVWLSAIPVSLATFLPLPATSVAKLLVVLGSGGTALFAYRLLPRVWRRLERSERPALLFAFVVLAFVLPARDLGQRDALAGIFVLPYVLACVPTSLPQAQLRLRRYERLSAALLAALAFCLKPQDALIAVTVEVALLLYVCRKQGIAAGFARRLMRLEIPVLLGSGFVYLLALRLFAPLYFMVTIPVLRATYWAIGHLAFPALLWQAIELAVLAGLTLFSLLWRRPASPASWTLFLAGCGAFLAYVLQDTGWYYQQLPALTLIGAALALHLLDLQQRRCLQVPRWSVPAVAGLCLLALALATHFMGYPFTTDRAFALTSPDPAFFRDLPPGTPVAILTTSVDEAMMPVEQFHLTWAQRTNNLWLLPAILRSEQPGPQSASRRLTPTTVTWLETLQHRWMVEDLHRWQPRLVLVERCQDPTVVCQVLEDRHDDLLAWFVRDPAFAVLWQQYHFVGRRDRFDAYAFPTRK